MHACSTDMLTKGDPTLMTMPAAGFADQGLGRLDVHRVELMRLQNAGNFQAVLFLNAVNDLTAFLDGARSDMDIAKHIVVLCTFMGNHLGYATRTNNQDILLHFTRKAPFLSLWGNRKSQERLWT